MRKQTGNHNNLAPILEKRTFILRVKFIYSFHSVYSYIIPQHPRYPPCCQSDFVLLLALSTLLLHPLAPRRFARQLLDLAVPVALRVALLARGFHRVDARGFVG